MSRHLFNKTPCIQWFSLVAWYKFTGIQGGYWSYEAQKIYEDYIMGVDDDGNKIMFTSNPEKLGNYFGVNAGAPHYLTPVYFSKEVLTKYYSKPEIYSVEDGIIRCGTLWSIYLDNLNKDYVSVYLGDLGRDLPSESEQLYWESFNIAIDGGLSNAKFQRDFAAQFSDPDSIDYIFKNKYIELNKKFTLSFNCPLFLELDSDDLYNFEGLRVPINNSIAEMDMLVLSLVKVLLDSINEKQIVNQLTGQYEKLIGSISKLEAWIVGKNLVGYQDHIKFLRNMQELRSSGTGHRKGEGYQKITEKLDIQKGNYREAMINIFEQSVSFLEYINSNIDNLK